MEYFRCLENRCIPKVNPEKITTGGEDRRGFQATPSVWLDTDDTIPSKEVNTKVYHRVLPHLLEYDGRGLQGFHRDR